MPPCYLGTAAALAAAALIVVACGDHGLLPTTIDPGPDFSVAEVVFDDSFYYCRIEPMLVERRCGAGDPASGDATNGCHANVTSFHLTPYSPLVADTCNGTMPASLSVPPAAEQNYQSAQAQMRRNPDSAPLLLRPTGKAQHPRVIFDATSPEADLIRQWATQYSTQ